MNYAMSGTATLNSDYTMSAAQITIPAGQNSGTVTLSAIVDNSWTTSQHARHIARERRPLYALLSTCVIFWEHFG